VTNVTIRTMHFSKFLRGFGLAWILLLVVSFAHMPVASAVTNYGRDDYGNCTYSTCQKHTTIQTPSGLKVAVNLTDGQVIPSEGYTITVTPLNGSGSSFKQAEVYIDGIKVATITPAGDGTASWRWDPSAYPGTQVQIIVMDQSGALTTFKFTVSIERVVAPADEASGTAHGGATHSEAGNQSFVSELLSAATESAKRVIKKLPAPIVYTFPYMLFALLLVEMIVLLLQTKREVRELATAKKLAAEEREIAGMKQTLMELVSHYLRTPLTILQGGAEGLARDAVEPATVTSLQSVVSQLHETIEALIATTSTAVTGDTGMDNSAPARRRLASAAGRIAIWLPVALVGFLVFGFVYLANEVSRFTTNTIGILTQVVVYSILILALYQVVRRWQLHRQDTAAAQKILQEEQAVQSLRDTLIDQTAAQLQAHVASLGALAKSLPTTAANAKFVTRGYAQLNTTTNKFVIASHLKGARSHEEFQRTSLQAMYGQVEKSLKQPIADKHLTVAVPAVDPVLTVQNPGLLCLVLKTVLDNAVAYSSDGGNIELEVNGLTQRSTISVTDHGSGIDAAKQAALFQPFFKAEGAEEFNREGMGFSLYLDKLIMAYLGGDITLESQPGTITRITMTWSAAKG
jgi:signal transduction histidine kinase